MTSKGDQSQRNQIAGIPYESERLAAPDENQPLQIKTLTSRSGTNYDGLFTLDNLLEEIGFGSYHAKRFLAAGFMAFMDGAIVMTMSLTLVILEKDWKFGSKTESIVASVVFVCIVVGAYISGQVADKYGRRMPMLVSCFLICIVNFASAFSSGLVSYTISRSLLGFACGFYSPIGFTYVLEIVPPSKRGKIITAGYSMLFLGELFVCLVSLFTLQSLNSGNWRALTGWSTIPAIISFLLSIVYLDESVRFLLIKGNYKEAKIHLMLSAKESWSDQKVEITEDIMVQLQEWVEFQEMVSSFQKAKTGIRVLIQKKYRTLTLIIWLAWFVLSFIYYGVTLFFPYILNEITEQEEASKADSEGGISSDILALSGNSLSSYAISIGLESFSVVISYFAIDSKLLGRKNGLVFFFAAACLFAFLGFVDQSRVALIIWTTLLKIMLDVCAFYCYLLTMEAYPTKYRATGMGAATAVGKAGTVLMPWICAFLLQVDPYGPYISFFILCAAASFAISRLPSDLVKGEMM